MIQCTRIKKSYKTGRNRIEVIKGLDMTIDDGELVAILGKSGSGKSTLLNLLGTLDVADSGNIVIDGAHLESMNDTDKAQFRKTKIGFVMQDYALINHQSVEYNIVLPMILNGTKRRDRKNKSKELAQKMGIYELLKKRSVDLSGGERQRVAIARALANNPDIILADEPTGALDMQTSSQIMDLFEEIHKTGKTIVIVTHDMTVAERCTRIIKIQDGVCEAKPSSY